MGSFSVGPIVGAALSFFTIPIITWFFSQDDVGRFSMFQLIINLGMIIVSLDMHQSYVREYYEVEKKEVLLKLAFIPGIVISIITFVLFQSLDVSLSYHFLGRDSTVLDFCIFLGVLFLFLINLFSHVLRMQGRGWAFSATQIIPKLGYLVFLLLFVYFFRERNYEHLIVTNVMVLSISSLCFILILWGEIKKSWSESFNTIVFKKMLKFSFPLLTGSLAYWALISVDRIILSYFRGFKEVGIYVVATTLAAGIGVFVTVFSNLWHPLVYRWVKEGIDPKKILLVNELMVLAIGFLWTIVGVFSWILVYFFPQQYNGIQYIIVACVAMPLLYMLSETTNVGIGISRKTSYAMLASVLAFLANVVVNYIAVPLFGVKGTALASMTSFVIFLILRTEFSSFLWKSLPRFKLYIFLLIYIILTLLHVFEIFKNNLMASIAWLFGFLMLCCFYSRRVFWIFERIKLGSF
nr:oligosaccharide flippase family protein [Acinetobacter wuhouensis]